MYSVFLDGVRLPVTPSSLEIQINNKNETYDLVSGGEINVIKTPGLTDISFEFELPNSPLPYAIYPDGFQGAKFFLDKLEELKQSDKPFRFLLTRPSTQNKRLFDTNFLVTIEDYTINEDAENNSDFVVSLSMKQYRPYATKVLNVSPPTQNNARQVEVVTKRDTSTKPPVRSHTVVSGDTLYLICKKYLNDGNRFREIARLNNIANPDRIFPGQVIRLG